jgi:hypothetical protein
MRKIRLDAEELDVLSFDTGAVARYGRTVDGHENVTETVIIETGPVKTADTRRYTCEPSLADTACTQDATCSPTACGISCDPYCIPDTA